MVQDEISPQDIIEMATKVWGKCDWHESALCHLEAFAKLVAAKEREACANLFSQPHMEYFGRDIQDAIRARGEA